jgi:hypothetical protein
MIEDVGEADMDFKDDGVFTGLAMALKDVKIYLMMFTTFLCVMGLTFTASFESINLIST